MTEEQYNRMIDKLPLKEARKLYRTYYKVYNNRFDRRIRLKQWDKAQKLIGGLYCV